MLKQTPNVCTMYKPIKFSFKLLNYNLLLNSQSKVHIKNVSITLFTFQRCVYQASSPPLVLYHVSRVPLDRTRTVKGEQPVRSVRLDSGPMEMLLPSMNAIVS